MTVSTSQVLPHWDLSNIYSGLEAQSFLEDVQRLATLLQEIQGAFPEQDSLVADLAGWVGEMIDRLNSALTLSATLSAYIRSFVTTDSYHALAKRRLSELEKINTHLVNSQTRFQALLGRQSDRLEEIIAGNKTAAAHAFALREMTRQSRYLMSPAEESLAVELNLSGAQAWSKLQGTVTSQLTVDFELDGRVQSLPIMSLINLRSHPDADIRRRAYFAEIEAWKQVQEPLAAAMNGVKGAVGTLNRRRGREDDLHSALDQARIDRETLEAMLSAMQASLPMFHRYLRIKAGRLGHERLPWWDLFAPTGKPGASYDFAAARAFILEHFGRFSPGLQALARRAFDQGWIDAEPRDGKRGGAFCMSLPAFQESRILCNFDYSLDGVFTIAHELGHAFHNEALFQAGKTALQRTLPMTLAETASILCETIVVNAALAQVSDPQEELAILETSLIGDAQVIVDIYSRYLFEKQVFERRAHSEISASELCNMMADAQKSAYGEGLDERYLHPYMWTWKPHYYRPELSFYNFPYAFGLLFGLGLFAIYQQRGPAFVPEYVNLLARTGENQAADLAAEFGIDIRSPRFWEDSLGMIARRIERYAQL
jgi:pepF/M3 family oligoendopeptidase